MKFAVSPIISDVESRASALSEGGTTSIRFGDVLFHMTDKVRWGGAAKAARASGLVLRKVAHQAPRHRLHMVIQKGRLFQQEHPEVPVLLDKGRYLIVDLTASKARKWACGDCPCYAIRPLPTAGVAFDVVPAHAARAPVLPWVKALVDQLDRATYEADLKSLVAATTRFSTSPQYAAVARSTLKILKGLGYTTRLQTITVNGSASSNVIAEKLGTGSAPRDVVIVSAHLDSINIRGGPTAPAPGADDDGSGSAGLLSIARVLKGHNGVHDLRLILFGGEEQGLFGSRQYVASLPASQRSRIRSVVTMDMIGTLNVNTPSVLLEGSTLSRPIIDKLADAAANHTHLSVQTSLHPFNSDHVSFLDAGIPAVLTIEGTDDANANIHSAGDTLSHISFDLALEIIRMNLAYIATSIGKTP